MGSRNEIQNITFVENLLRPFSGPGQFPGIAGNTGNHGKFHKNDQMLNQTKRNTNKLCLRNISRNETVKPKFSVDPGFRMSSMVKNENPEMPEINRKLPKLKSTQC